jgi:uncharacterized protein YjbI with pentapeptide repeats
MANVQQLEILKQGADIWNHWRAEQKSTDDFDLNGADLRGLNLDKVNLCKAN